MNAIEAMGAEIAYQVEDLSRQELPIQSKNCLFIGSGDSYVAGLAAFHVSGGRALCCYPADLLGNPSLANGRNVFVVSISGNTKANILAAKVAGRHSNCVTAITARTVSPLATACDRAIELKYRSAGVNTSRTISFTSSMLACISLTTKFQMPNLTWAYRQAERQAKRLTRRIGNKSTYFILGNALMHPPAIYGALKFNEIFGVKAIAHQVEDFCHSPLFSVKKDSQVIVIGGDGKHLNDRLVQEGFSSVHADFKGTGIEQLMQSTFFMQLLVLKLAQGRKLTTCYFLKNKKLLRMSSDFIYD